MKIAAIVIFAASCLIGCETEVERERVGEFNGEENDGKGTASGESPDTDNKSPAGTGVGCSGMDILFVIDDSGSMSQEQDNLAANFPRFIDVLDNYKTQNNSTINYRVGVTTTGVNRNFKQRILNMTVPTNSTGPNGRLLGTNDALEPNCGLVDPWLPGPGDDVASTFACMANVGISGSGTEMPFAALEAALGDGAGQMSRPGGPNEGFYRRDQNSLLVVVIITDEDDCSIRNGGVMVVGLLGGSDCNEQQSKNLYAPEEIKDFLDATAGEGRYVVVGIGGPKQCSSSFGDAYKAKRLQALVDLCGDFGVFGNICEGDLWSSLETALEVMKVTCNEMGPV